MRKAVILLLAIIIITTSCAVKTRNLRLESDDNIEGLNGPGVEADILNLESRANELWTELTTQKLTAHITKRKIASFFKNSKDLSEFIAIYASLFRELKFDREIVRSYKINSITLEPNGVIALVDISIKGRIYFVWQGKLHEVQKWVKSGGEWYLLPQAY